MPAHWDDLKTVMHLVRKGSLATAGDALEVSYTTVARRIKRIEEDLGLQLFERLADGYQPTDAGRLVAERAAAMESQEHDLMRHLSSVDETLKGTLTITAPQLVFTGMIGPAIREYSRLYPEVQIQLRASVEMLDLSRREADLAIRVSNDPGDSLVGRRLAQQQSGFFAVPELVDMLGKDPKARVNWIGFNQNPKVPDVVMEHFPNTKIGLLSDDYISMLSAAKMGVGIVEIPFSIGRQAEGLRLIETLPPREFPDIWMVAHRDVWASAKVAAFRELLLPIFRERRTQFTA